MGEQDTKVVGVVTRFLAGKMQKNGNPLVKLTVETALIPQELLSDIGTGTSNYVEVTFHPIRGTTKRWLKDEKV